MFTNTHIAFKHLSNYKLRIASYIFCLMRYKYFIYFSSKILLYLSKFKFPIWFLIRNNLFAHFCGGENLKDLEKIITDYESRGLKICFSYSVEGKEKSLKNIDRIINKNLSLINLLNKSHFIALKLSGIISSSILIKLQKKTLLTKLEQDIFIYFQEKLHKLIQEASKKDIIIVIDAEESWFQDTIDHIAFDLMKKFNHKKAYVYTTVQMYRRDRLEYLKNLITSSKNLNFQIGIKLVRGAYVEKEKDYYKENLDNYPLFSTKNYCDNAYNDALKIIFENINHVAIFAGTHNKESMTLFYHLYKNLQNHKEKAIASQLLGMGDVISYNLVNKKIPVCKYIPFGPIYEVIPYLIRRMEENSSLLDEAQGELELLNNEKKRRYLKF